MMVVELNVLWGNGSPLSVSFRVGFSHNRFNLRVSPLRCHHAFLRLLFFVFNVIENRVNVQYDLVRCIFLEIDVFIRCSHHLLNNLGILQLFLLKLLPL